MQSHGRGIAILIANTLKFIVIKEIKENEGRYINIVKGTIEEDTVTLVNVYATPNSNKLFFK